MEVDLEDLQEMTGFIEETTGVLEKHASVEAKVNEAAPILVDRLIKAGMLQPSERSVALVNLQDPLKVMMALDQIAMSKIASADESKKTSKPMGSSGNIQNAGSIKTASERREERSEADLAYERRLGLI